ncbi:MAG TPA: hypothetical protein VL358_10060 [Caulobacteraceae bacterium]|jgi:hypothetical protein|nr:hypothetical protein [Caulobacteraceae bacterium]
MPDPISMPDESGEPTLSTADLAQAGRAQERASEERAIQERPGEDRSFQTEQAEGGPLFPGADAEAMRRHWTEIQAAFVDEPRRAVEQADGLVAEAIKKLAEMFTAERDRLESQWDRGDDVNTEELRQALQRYRSFFTRLLAV